MTKAIFFQENKKPGSSFARTGLFILKEGKVFACKLGGNVLQD